jgi:hypothetical protein
MEEPVAFFRAEEIGMNMLRVAIMQRIPMCD